MEQFLKPLAILMTYPLEGAHQAARAGWHPLLVMLAASVASFALLGLAARIEPRPARFLPGAMGAVVFYAGLFVLGVWACDHYYSEHAGWFSFVFPVLFPFLAALPTYLWARFVLTVCE